jgi:L-2-hydroxyglutarate oxidase LhgO
MADIIKNETILFFKDAFGFRSLAYEEMKKYNKNYFVSLAQKMVYELDQKGYNQWSTPGIRAQLLNTTTLELVQDFVVEKSDNTIHVLNAVSPAFTASQPFATHIVHNYIK